MLTSTSFSAVDTRSVMRRSGSHTYSVPVVRELPRPVPRGLGTAAW